MGRPMEAQQILEKVCRAIDVLVEIGGEYEGLFPSLIDREAHRMLDTLPPAIEGQRDGDRSHLGSNLMHDEVTLKTMYALSAVLDRPDYAGAADRYLKRFATHCTDTVSGIFPWGEHAYWHLVEDRVGDSYLLRDPSRKGSPTHDQLRQAPLWLWEKLYDYNPGCVERFAEGIDNHWTEEAPLEYIRHAYIDRKAPYSRGARSCDFPRHGGFYIFDWTFAYLKTGRTDFLEQIERMLEYWWPRRDEKGLLLIESRSPETDEDFYGVNAPGQTLSLGVSLLESADLLESKEPELAGRMRERAAVYIGGFLAAPHDPDGRVFVVSCKRGDDTTFKPMPIWGSVYGLWPASYVALTALCAHQIREQEPLLRWSEAVGQAYLETPFAEGVAAPAMDSGLGLGLLADLYDITGEEKWLEGGMELADRLMEIYMDRDLPRGAAGIDWYESQMGPGFLLHGLARIALMAKGGTPCPLEADYTAR